MTITFLSWEQQCVSIFLSLWMNRITIVEVRSKAYKAWKSTYNKICIRGINFTGLNSCCFCSLLLQESYVDTDVDSHRNCLNKYEMLEGLINGVVFLSNVMHYGPDIHTNIVLYKSVKRHESIESKKVDLIGPKEPSKYLSNIGPGHTATKNNWKFFIERVKAYVMKNLNLYLILFIHWILWSYVTMM